MSNSDSKNIKCFFCHRDLSKAQNVNYVMEGPICTVCLMNKQNEDNNRDDELDRYEQIILG